MRQARTLDTTVDMGGSYTLTVVAIRLGYGFKSKMCIALFSSFIDFNIWKWSILYILHHIKLQTLYPLIRDGEFEFDPSSSETTLKANSRF